MTPRESNFGRAFCVVHVVYATYPSDPRVRRVVETQRDWGLEVHVIALRDYGQALEETIEDVAVSRIPLGAVRGGRARYAFQYAAFVVAATWAVFRLRFHHRVGVVHIHSLPDFLVVAAAPAKARGAKVVLDLHEAMPEIVRARFHLPERSLLVRAARGLEWISCAFADAVLTATEPIRDLLVRRGTDPAKVTVVMNSPRSVAPGLANLSVLRTSLNLNGHRPIVYVGGLNRERDVGLLVQAVAGIHSDPPVRLVVFGYGDDEYRTYLQDVALHEGLADFVLGPRLPQDQVLSHLALTDVGVVTYERNPLTELAVPNKVFEYSAVGKPLVLARLPSLESLFGDAALYYEPGDSKDLREKIQYILENQDVARLLASRGSAVLARCNWEIMADRLRSVYARLTQSGGF